MKHRKLVDRLPTRPAVNIPFRERVDQSTGDDDISGSDTGTVVQDVGNVAETYGATAFIPDALDGEDFRRNAGCVKLSAVDADDLLDPGGARTVFEPDSRIVGKWQTFYVSGSEV